jgi:LacI family transcriptional regulator
MSKNGRKRVTLGDVAAKAGVSVATASVAITGKPSGNCRVSPAVAERIRKTARLLNYRPNIQARSLSTQRTQSIAMLVKRCNWRNAMFYLASAQRVLRQNGYTEIFFMHQEDELESERQHIEMCLDRRVEGILVMPVIDQAGQTNASLLNQIQRDEGIPVVQVGIALPQCDGPAVLADDADGTAQAVRHLHELGHQQIAHYALPGFDDTSAHSAHRPAHERYSGYLRAMQELSLSPRLIAPPLQNLPDELRFETALRVGRDLAEDFDQPTAIVAGSDVEAAGLMAAFHEIGVRVPRQISVIGLGDEEFARMARPALSTIAPPLEQMGQCATEMLLSIIAGGEGQSIALPPTLVLRDSTGPAYQPPRERVTFDHHEMLIDDRR